jgi:DNA-directed RNA polymerase specialized sigma24 family protein
MSKINRRRRSEMLVRCVPMLRAYVRGLVDDPEVAADVFQEIILHLLSDPMVPEELAGFAEHGRRVSRDLARGERPISAELPFEDPPFGSGVGEEPQDPWLDPERAVDTREALERAVHHLGEDALELLVRRYVLGENARELATGRSQTPAALRVRLMRLRSSARAAR